MSNPSVFEIEARADYVDTDAMAVVHHASYFRYLERARVEWLRAHGLNYKEMEAQGLYLPLTGAEIQYKKSLFFDDEFTVRLWVAERSVTRVTLEYEIWKEAQLCVTAKTFHVLCRKEGTNWIPEKIPELWRTTWLLPNDKKS